MQEQTIQQKCRETNDKSVKIAEVRDNGGRDQVGDDESWGVVILRKYVSLFVNRIQSEGERNRGCCEKIWSQ